MIVETDPVLAATPTTTQRIKSAQIRHPPGWRNFRFSWNLKNGCNLSAHNQNFSVKIFFLGGGNNRLPVNGCASCSAFAINLRQLLVHKTRQSVEISNFARFHSAAASIFQHKMMAEDSAQISNRIGCLLSLKHRSDSGIFTFKIPDLTDSHVK